MKETYSTSRLFLTELHINDAEFISTLVNTPEWIKFIGDRNIRTKADAEVYIHQLISNPNTHFWVVKTQDQLIPIGVVTYIKRDYLAHADIGFAFLPNYTKQGYAYEATLAVLTDLITDPTQTQILATTIKTNVNSIRLLEKLGLQFSEEIERENELLQVYAITVDKLHIDQLTTSFFSIFTNTNQQEPNWSSIHALCLPETIIIKKNQDLEEVYNLTTFITPRKKILSDGTLTEFEEYELDEDTTIIGNIAQRISKFQKKGYHNGSYFKENGTKFLQYIKTNNGWKINAVVWEDEMS